MKERKKEKKTEILTCRSRAYYVSAGQKGALTFDFEKLNFTAFLQLIYLNSWTRNVLRTQHFLIQPWTCFSPPWSCFGPFILKGAMWTIIEIALTVIAQNVII